MIDYKSTTTLTTRAPQKQTYATWPLLSALPWIPRCLSHSHWVQSKKMSQQHLISKPCSGVVDDLKNNSGHRQHAQIEKHLMQHSQ